MFKNKQPLKDSFLNVPQQRSGCFRILKKLDVFSFVPFPKNQPVTTNQSLCGSLLFLLIILSYIIVDFVAFIQYNPPSIQTYQTKLGERQYILPRFAINFMEGQNLNETKDYDDTFSFELTQQSKSINNSSKTTVPLSLNAKQNLTWISNQTQQFYQRLSGPSDDMIGRGLLYSTAQTFYSKITIKLCDVNELNNTCKSFQDISSLCAKGRIFLFVEQQEDTSTLGDLTNYGTNRYNLFNIFLIPQLYKRFTVQFQVVRTNVLADYFYRFQDQQTQRLQVSSIIQQTSNTSINDYQNNRSASLQVLGVTFNLNGQIRNVRASYETIIDRVAKWGAFSNLVFTIFCIIFLAYNRKKFYERHPDWDRFKKKRNQQLNQQNQQSDLNKRQ